MRPALRIRDVGNLGIQAFSARQGPPSALRNHHTLTRRAGLNAVLTRTALRRASTFITLDDVAQDEQPTSITHAAKATIPKRRAKAPISSIQDLDFQSDVNHEPTEDSPLLVDTKKHRNNLTLWFELFDFRYRLHGHDGAKDVFYGMRKRDIPIPTTSLGNDIWHVLLAAAASCDTFREDLWMYALEQAKSTGYWWKDFWVEFLGPLVRNEPGKAIQWVRRMHRATPRVPKRGCLQQLYEPARLSAESLNAFIQIYLAQPDRNAYSWLVPSLCERNLFKEALNLHYFLLKQRDYPNTNAEVEELAKHVALFSDQTSFDHFKKSLNKINPSLANDLSTVVGQRTELHDDEIVVEERPDNGGSSSGSPISDATAARAFATRAFSVDFIITGLLSFKFRVLGLAAMRELAVRSKSVAELSEHLDRVKKEGVVIEDRVYTKLMQRLATSRNQSMFEAVLESDMHPEVYDDRVLQLRLLEQYIEQDQWNGVHRTLTILTALHHDPSEQAWNILLRTYMVAKNWRMISIVSDDMISQRITITEQTIKKSFFMLLRARTPGKALPHQNEPGGVDDLAFLTRLWLKILNTKGHVPFYAWRQVLTYYGIGGRLDELESLCLTLTRFYRGQTRMSEPIIPETVLEKEQTLRRIQRFRPRGPDQRDLELIFTPAKQRAIVEWGFKTLGRNMPKPGKSASYRGVVPGNEKAVVKGGKNDAHWLSHMMQWDRGLRLLQALRLRGLKVDWLIVRSAVRYRLQVLFHADYIPKKSVNRTARLRIPFTLGTMVKQVHQVAGFNLLGLPMRLLLDESPQASKVLARAVLGASTHYKSRQRYRDRVAAPKTTKVIESKGSIDQLNAPRETGSGG